MATPQMGMKKGMLFPPCGQTWNSSTRREKKKRKKKNCFFVSPNSPYLSLLFSPKLSLTTEFDPGGSFALTFSFFLSCGFFYSFLCD
jgi:hypothetical protein